MNQDDYKKLLEEALYPIKKVQDELRKDLKDANDGVKEVKDTVEERVLPSLVTIETEIKTYADMYKHSLR